jgi:hypothetical protein
MRRVVFQFPAFFALASVLASVLAVAAFRRSTSVRERLGRIDLGEWLDTIRPRPIEIESAP